MLVCAAIAIAFVSIIPLVGYVLAVVAADGRVPARALRAGALRRASHAREVVEGTVSKLILVVIDGLTPSMLEGAVSAGTRSDARVARRQGEYGRAISTFPSLTPVCLSSIATGAHGDVHEIPHLVWWHRGEGRIVEYGSSFGAARAAGSRTDLA